MDIVKILAIIIFCLAFLAVCAWDAIYNKEEL